MDRIFMLHDDVLLEIIGTGTSSKCFFKLKEKQYKGCNDCHVKSVCDRSREHLGFRIWHWKEVIK